MELRGAPPPLLLPALSDEVLEDLAGNDEVEEIKDALQFPGRCVQLANHP